MNRKPADQSLSARSSEMQKAAIRMGKDGSRTVQSLFPLGSSRRVAAGIAAAAGTALFAGLTFGVGPAALAGAAGYLAYRGLSGERKK
jgi:hypothetical protein